MPEMIVAPAPEELLKLIGPEVTNLLSLMKQIKQIDREVTVLSTKVLSLPKTYGLKARELRGVLMPFGGLMLRIGTLESSPGWCWLEIEPYGSIDEEYFRTHWDAMFGGMKSLLDEAGAIALEPRLGGASFVVPA